jgi:Zn-dependent protease with chaperone function
LDEALENAKAELLDSGKAQERQISVTFWLEAQERQMAITFWLEAQERIKGQCWQYMLFKTLQINAFVVAIFPQQVFMTTGLLDLIHQSDNELAMVLGHEIAHFILGHAFKLTLLRMVIRFLDIVILMLDPTTYLGIAGFLVGGLAEVYLKVHSQSQETEADELGCKLAAMASYNTDLGSILFTRYMRRKKACCIWDPRKPKQTNFKY